MGSQDVDNTVSKDMGTDHLDQVESQKDGFMEETARVVDHPAERALCFKFDIRILPILALMYLFNALDKGNLGNAQTKGLSTGTHPPPYLVMVSNYKKNTKN
ncbi:uncharacterized protein TrAtP1_008219 [Trichoderma atroviride]|uniref:uncharacterized protein n=1 Tax=Hypocrea atroviridis TaxID=63577 RepID=UPI0033347E36|nr:hypothetical protein TrAtP1_008219 [Trichoderma atroviride]